MKSNKFNKDNKDNNYGTNNYSKDNNYTRRLNKIEPQFS